MIDEDSIFRANPNDLRRLVQSGMAKDDAGAERAARVTASIDGLLEQPGARIGRYKLLSVLGEGGMGIVYLAEQEKPVKRQVALKVIKPGMDSARILARFEAEQQALALMDHPHVAHVYDAGLTGSGRPYFVMECVKGVPITEHCDKHKLTIEERLRLFLHVCGAVQHAHQKGIIHRDLKPSNILVAITDDEDMPKVIDFGVAKALGQSLTDQTLVTEGGQFVGTPEYMSPEQADLTAQDIDTRSDVYSLGVVLYELLAGALPFDSETLRAGGSETIRKIISEDDPKTPSTRLTGLGEKAVVIAQQRRTDVVSLTKCLHRELEWIPMKAMRKDRTRRYQTVYTLADDVQRYLNQEPILAGPPSTVYKMRKFVVRNKGLVSSLAAVAVILVLATTVSISQMIRANEAAERERIVSARLGVESKRALQAEKTAKLERDRAEEQELQARQRAYASDMNLLAKALSMNDLGQARALLHRHRPASPNAPDLRGWEWRYFWQQCQSEAQKFCQTNDYVNSLSVSHDGKWLAVGNNGEYGGVSVWDVQNRQRIATLASETGQARVAFSPREPLLAFFFRSAGAGALDSGSGYIRLWDLENRQTVGELPLEGTCTALEFSSGGECLVSSTRTQITLWSVAELKRLASYAVDQSYMYIGKTLALAPDLSFLVHTTANNWVRVLDLSTGEERWSAPAAGERLSTLALSPDGRILASNDAFFVQDTIRLWDVASGKEIGQLEGHRVWISDLLFLPDGQTLVSASDDQTIRVWDVSDPGHGKLVSILRGHNAGVWRIALLPDKRTLMSGDVDGAVYSWDLEKRPQSVGPVTLSNVSAFCFSGEGSGVLTVNSNGQVIQYEGPEYSESQTLFDLPKRKNIEQTDVVFSDDGRKIAMRSGKGTVGIWDVPSGAEICSLKSPQTKPKTFLNHDEQVVTFNWISGSYDVWDVSTRQRISSWSSDAKVGDYGPALSADSRWFLTVDLFGGRTTLRDLLNKSERHSMLDISTTTDVAFSPDNTLFAASSRKGIVKLWERETMREIIADRRFMIEAWSVAFSPDGNRLAAGCGGLETVKIWDVKSHQELLTLAGTGSVCYHTVFSPDGNTLATIDKRRRLHLWCAPSWEDIANAESN